MNRERYSITEMCQFFGVSRSGYYDYVKRLDQPAHDAALAEIIRKQQEKCDKTYGYRRMWKWLKKVRKIHRNPKTILRIMKKYDLLSEIRRQRKWRQMSTQLHKYDNLLNREFHADQPNHKWVTDISYIRTRQGVLYLSIIRDLFTIASLPIRQEPLRASILCWIRYALPCKKKRKSLRSCSSTATKAVSTPRKHTLT